MKRPLSIALAALLAAASSGAGAQFGGGMKRGGGDQRGARPQAGKEAEAARPQEDFTGGFDLQLADTSAKLKLGPEQRPLWEAYQASVIAVMDDQMRAPPGAAPGDSAVRQIERKVDVVRNRLAAMEDVADAARKLYASLNAEQRAVADQLLPGTAPTLYSGFASLPGRRPPRQARSDGSLPPAKP